MVQLINNKLSIFFQALSHPIRLEIIKILNEKEKMCVCEMVALLKKDQSIISRHLNSLKIAGIIDFEERGVRSFYKIKSKKILKIIQLAKKILIENFKKQQEILLKF